MERRVDGALVLVGFMGAGKSTGARTLAAELGASAVDSDLELERALGEPIEQFFDRHGEAAFRAREEEMVCELLARGNARVIALGGGAVQSERVREALGGTPWFISRSTPRTLGAGLRGAGARSLATQAGSPSCTATG